MPNRHVLNNVILDLGLMPVTFTETSRITAAMGLSVEALQWVLDIE